jgi:acetyl-CoA acetyltransferase
VTPPPADGRWSPFARPPWRDCQAAAEAVLRARELEHCALDELTHERYADIRARHPHIGLPRATTIEKACGSWSAAVEQAAALVSRALRLNFVTE